MNNAEIITNLKTLGLEIGASPDDIHSAFRRLARELHPDIAGSDFRFKQVAGAYNALKNLTSEELNIKTPKKTQKNIYDIYNAEKKRKSEEAVINSILDKYEEEFKNRYSNRKNFYSNIDIADIIFRLKSSNYKVVNSALKHSGHLANRVEFRRAFSEILKRPEVHDSTAEIIEALPFDDMTRKLIALDVADNAENFPTMLIINLIGSDSDVMESFLMHVKPDDVSVILRRWPSGKIINSNVLRKLLDSNDARILVPVLGAIKTHFPNLSLQHKKRLKELENHSTAAVRAWARKLTK